jgi:hypothetical protein
VKKKRKKEEEETDFFFGQVKSLTEQLTVQAQVFLN